MDELLELVKVVSKNRVKNIDIISGSDNNNNKSNALYHAIASGKAKTDKEAAELLYGSTDKNPAYQKLKYRLKKRLLDTLFFIDTNRPNYTDQRKALVQLNKEWVSFKLLINHLARRTAVSIGEDMIKKSRRFEFTDITLLVARELRQSFGYLLPNQKKYKYYSDIIERSLEELAVEFEAEKYYSEISNIFVFSGAKFSEENLQKLESYCEKLSSYYPKYQHYLFIYHYYQLLSFLHISKKNYGLALKACVEILDIFQSKPYQSKFAEYSFRNDAIVCHLNLFQYTKAENLIKANLSLLSPGIHNWFKVMGYYFSLSILSKNYQKSYELVSNVVYQKSLININKYYESWSIKEAYIHFLVKAGKIDPSIIDAKPLKKFRINRFLNDVPIYSKAKRGLNISILIAQILFLILNKRFAEIVDRADSLNQYCYRYLRNDDTLRSNCFIKMLLKVPEADYHPVRVKRYVKKFHDKLLNTALDISDQSLEVEIIPYEILWEMILELLEKK